MSAAEYSVSCESKELYDKLIEITTRTAGMTGAEGAALALWQSGMLISIASCGRNAPQVGVPVQATSFAGQCFNKGAVMVCDNAGDDPRVDPGACRALGIGSMVATPILVRGKPEGVLTVFAAPARAFTRSKVDLVNTMAIIAGELLQTDPEKRPQITRNQPTAAIAPPQAVQSADSAQRQEKHTAPAVVMQTAPQALTAKERGSAEASAGRVSAQTSIRSREPRLEPARQEDPHSKDAARLDSRDEDAAVPEFCIADTAPSSRGHVLSAAIVVTIVAAAIAGAVVFRGRTTTAQASSARPAAVAPSPIPEPKREDSVAAVAAPVPASTQAAAPAPQKTKPLTPAAAPAPSPYSTRPPAMLIFSGARGRQAEEPDVVPAPTLQLASGAAPIAFSAKASLPKGPAASVTPAVLVRKVAPSYPPGVVLTGTVSLSATIQKDGRLGNISATGGSPLLRAAAATALKQWLYKPAMLNGQPVESTIDINVNFEGKR